MPASSIKLGAIDLNLLVIFDAVMQERNVTRAGERLALSQPAVSHALTRLRHLLKDDLFVRTPKGMAPTPRAEQIAAPVRQALDALRHSLEPPAFDPSAAAQTFRIAVDNDAAVALVGRLAAQITKLAPGLTLDFRPSGTLELADLFDRGALDLAIGSFDESAERFSREILLQDGFVAVLRKGHPAATAGAALSIQDFSDYPHLEITSIRHSTDFVDQALARRKLKRRLPLRAPFLSAARILASSDMICVFPRRIAEELVSYRPLVMSALPIPSPLIETVMISPRWMENQPAHHWLRQAVRNSLLASRKK